MSKDSKTQFRVWCENGDLVDVCDTWTDVLAARNRAVSEHLEMEHVEACECGVLYFAGYFVQAIEDNEDVTNDYALGVRG